MSLNVRETVPLIFLESRLIERPPGPSFAIVCGGAAAEALTCPSEPTLRLVRAGLGDLEQALEAEAATRGPAHPLAQVLASPDIDGILLTGCRGRADLEAASVSLGVIEAEAGRDPGALRIVASLDMRPGSLLRGLDMGGCPDRLRALVMDESALARALGLPDGTHPEAPVSAAIAYARGVVVLTAAAAGVPCFWLLPDALTDVAALARLRSLARDEGFCDVAVRGAAQWLALVDGVRR